MELYLENGTLNPDHNEVFACDDCGELTNEPFSTDEDILCEDCFPCEKLELSRKDGNRA